VCVCCVCVYSSVGESKESKQEQTQTTIHTHARQQAEPLCARKMQLMDAVVRVYVCVLRSALHAVHLRAFIASGCVFVCVLGLGFFDDG